MGLDPSLARNVSVGYYEAGHMMYIAVKELDRLKADIAAFIKTALLAP